MALDLVLRVITSGLDDDAARVELEYSGGRDSASGIGILCPSGSVTYSAPASGSVTYVAVASAK